MDNPFPEGFFDGLDDIEFDDDEEEQQQEPEPAEIEVTPEVEQAAETNQADETEAESEPEQADGTEANPEPEQAPEPKSEIEVPSPPPPVESAENLARWFHATQRRLRGTLATQQRELNRLVARSNRMRGSAVSWSCAEALERAIARAGGILKTSQQPPVSPLGRLELARSLVDLLAMQTDPDLVDGFEALLTWLGVTEGTQALVDIAGSPTWRIDKLAENVDDCCRVFEGRHDRIAIGLAEARDDFLVALAELRVAQTEIRRHKSGPRYVAERGLATMARLDAVLPPALRSGVRAEWRAPVIDACQRWPRSKLCRTRFARSMVQ